MVKVMDVNLTVIMLTMLKSKNLCTFMIVETLIISKGSLAKVCGLNDGG